MRKYFCFLAILSLSLPATLVTAGEAGSYTLVDVPQRAFAHAQAYTAGRLPVADEQAAAEQPATQETDDPNATGQSNIVLAPQGAEESTVPGLPHGEVKNLLGAISTRLDPQELARAQQLGYERAAASPTAEPSFRKAVL